MKRYLFFGVLICFLACNRPYKPNSLEKRILENSTNNYEIILNSNYEKFNKIHDHIWDEIEYYGNKKRDVKVGDSTDYVFYPTLRCIGLIDTLIEGLERKKMSNLSILEFRRLYQNVGEIKCSYNINLWTWMIVHKKLPINTLSDSSNYFDVYNELFIGQNQKEILNQLKLTLFIIYNNILESYEYSVGSSCRGWGPNIEPVIILSLKNSALYPFYESKVFMIDYSILTHIERKRSYFDGKKLEFAERGASIRIPIVDSTLGEKSFDIVSSFKYYGREFKSITTGHYLVIKK